MQETSDVGPSGMGIGNVRWQWLNDAQRLNGDVRTALTYENFEISKCLSNIMKYAGTQS